MRTSLALVALFVGVTAGVQPSCVAAPANSKQAVMTEASKKTAKEAQLKQGMSADQVLKIMGKPTETNPMEAPSGKAEVWIYRTRQELSRERFETATRPITTLVRDSNGNERTQVIGHESTYGVQKRVLVRSYQVLMFNDHLLNEKLQLEEVRETE
ncbi:MAG TPA: outer membrane protein assembly factor BamE [Opitutaceae bacterium]|nr:outer membrane protein assembly factor BamE [Opitutaceae bacterium]